MDDEILDVVNGFDEVIGTVNRKDYAQFRDSKAGFIRAVDLFLMNGEGKLWIPVRTATKTIAPNGYDFSAAGHVSSGEDYFTTLVRETQEEINIDITPKDVEFVAKVASPTLRYFDSIYLLRTDQTPTYNPHDFVSAEWLTPQELLKNIADGHPTKDSIAGFVQILQTYLSGAV